MSALEQIIADLRSVEADLHDQPAFARRIRDITSRLTGDQLRWITQAEAERILEVQNPQTIATWVRLGLLVGRRMVDGPLEVQLGSVLKQQDRLDALTGDGDDRELTDEELVMLGRTPQRQPEAAPTR